MAEILEVAGSLDPSQTVSLKTCSKCRETKPVGEFYRNTRYKSGLNGQCAVCVKENRARYRSNPENLSWKNRRKREVERARRIADNPGIQRRRTRYAAIDYAGPVRPWQEMLASIGAP